MPCFPVSRPVVQSRLLDQIADISNLFESFGGSEAAMLVVMVNNKEVNVKRLLGLRGHADSSGGESDESKSNTTYEKRNLA
jgi:hypothetical protein